MKQKIDKRKVAPYQRFAAVYSSSVYPGVAEEERLVCPSFSAAKLTVGITKF